MATSILQQCFFAKTFRKKYRIYALIDMAIRHKTLEAWPPIKS